MGRILVVDDEPHILRLVSFSLANQGHEVIEASDGLTGVKLAEEKQPDLVLLDVMMPIMSGLEALDRLKKCELTIDIPVAMLSARSQSYEQEEGLKRGAVRYISKPFTPKDLVEAVAEMLGIQSSDEGETS